MERFSQLFFAIILLPQLLAAQTNYQPAITVNLKGDTVHGFIDYREWVNNPKSISFKVDQAGADVKLSANDIKYFNVNVGHLAEYTSYKGPVSNDNTNTAINHISVGRDTSFKNETVFLKVIQEGKNLVLLSYVDDLKPRFFIADNLATQPSELVYRVYWNSTVANGQDRTTYETAFKGQLYDVGVKAGTMTPALKKQIKNAGYREEDLMDIGGKINGASPTDPAKNNPTKPKGINKAIAIIGGILVSVWVVTQFVVLHSNHR